MSKLTQKSAVYAAIVQVLGLAGVHFEDGMDVGPVMSKELRAQVNEILFAGFKAGSIELDKTYTDASLKSYVSGLQSNWIRKDKRLNGNTEYKPKNPGSRVGSGDEMLKQMRNLLKITTNEADRAEIEGFIEQRQAEIAASKAKTVVVNYDALPAELRAKFAKTE